MISTVHLPPRPANADTEPTKSVPVDRLTPLPKEVLENVLAHAATSVDVLERYSRTCKQAARTARLFAERVLVVQQSSLLNRADESTVLGGRGADLPAPPFCAENERAAHLFLTKLANNTPPQRARRLLMQAGAKNSRGQFLAAEESCRLALALHPTLFAAHTLLADALKAQGRNLDAEVSYRAALTLQPRSYEALVGLARLYRLSSRVAEADACSQQAVELRPQSAEAHALRGHELCRLRRDNEAITSFQTALTLDTRDDATRAALGALLRDLERPMEAREHFAQLRRLRPCDQFVLLDTVDLLITLNRYEEADNHFADFFNGIPYFHQHKQDFIDSGLTSSCPISAHTFATSSTLDGVLTAIDFSSGPHAEELFREAITLCPSHVRAHVHLGEFLLSWERFVEAEKAFRQAVTLAPNDARAMRGLYYALARQDDRWADKESSLQQALNLNPRDSDLYTNMAHIHDHPGAAKQCEIFCMKALELNPMCVETHELLARALINQNRIEEAEVVFRRGLTFYPGAILLRSNLADLLMDQKKYVEVEVHLRQLLVTLPGDQSYRDQLDQVLLALGRSEQAEE